MTTTTRTRNRLHNNIPPSPRRLFVLAWVIVVVLVVVSPDNGPRQLLLRVNAQIPPPPLLQQELQQLQLPLPVLVDCSQYQESYSVPTENNDITLTLRYVVDAANNVFRGQVIYVGDPDSDAWVGFAVSPDGGMIGSQAIVGFPALLDSTTTAAAAAAAATNTSAISAGAAVGANTTTTSNPGIYNLLGRALAMVELIEPQPTDLVTAASIERNDTHVIMSFQIPFNHHNNNNNNNSSNPQHLLSSINPNGVNHLLVAGGFNSNFPAPHRFRGAVVVTLSPCGSFAAYNNNNNVSSSSSDYNYDTKNNNTNNNLQQPPPPPATTTTTTMERITYPVGAVLKVEGFVIDQFCIQQGTLLDQPSVITLEQPNLHSLHCLLDVESCVNSNFEILLDKSPASAAATAVAVPGQEPQQQSNNNHYYRRGFVLDAPSKARVMEVARTIGICNTCTTTPTRMLERGFRVMVNATVITPAAATAVEDSTTAITGTMTPPQPQTISVSSVEPVYFFKDSSTSMSTTVGLLQIGDRITAQGYVMDRYCIELGTLLDNPSVATLEDPSVHTLHCLMDVDACATSVYEILLDPPAAAPGSLYTRGFVLDETSKNLIRDLALWIGDCDSCGGTLKSGFRVEVRGIVVALGSGDIPPTISVIEFPTAIYSSTTPNDNNNNSTYSHNNSHAEQGNSNTTNNDYASTTTPAHNIIVQEPSQQQCPELESSFSYSGTHSFGDGIPLAFNYTVNYDKAISLGTFSAEVTYGGTGWVGFGISTNGSMVGSLAIIGVPPGLLTTTNAAYNPGKYILYGKSADAIALSAQQTLLNGNVRQSINNQTVLTFTKLLEEPGEIPINYNGKNYFLVAAGSDSSTLQYHAHRAAVELLLTPCTAANAISEAVVDSAAGGGGGVSCSQGSHSLDGSPLTFNYAVDGMMLHGEVVYEGVGWVGFAVSRTGGMIGSSAIIGLPAAPPSATNPGFYNLTARGPASIILLATTGQNAASIGNIFQNSTHTALIFDIPYENADVPGLSIDPFGGNLFLIAAGVDNRFTTHAVKESFRVDFNSCGNNHTAPPMVFVSDASTQVDLLRVGDSVTVEGFVMDTYCLDLGYLLDAPNVVTLEEPNKHSVHCLIDVEVCAASYYEILLDPAPGTINYARGFRLDNSSKILITDMAKRAGVCQTCSGEGNVEFGFRVRVMGTVLDLGRAQQGRTLQQGGGSIPPTISVEMATPVEFLQAIDDSQTTPAPGTASTGPNNGPVGCSRYEYSYTFPNQPLRLDYAVSVDEKTWIGTFSAQVTYEGLGWVGFAISQSELGSMVGSLAIIGLPNEPPSQSNPAKYYLGGTVLSSVTKTDQQTLIDGSIFQNETHTVLTFTKLLQEQNETAINPVGLNTFLVAAGFGNELQTHKHRGAVGLTLAPCTADNGGAADANPVGVGSASPKEAPYQAHGIFAAIAWAIFAPIAIGISLCRHLIPKEGLWFQIHRGMNIAILVLTSVAFAIAVGAVSAAGGKHFDSAVNKHKIIGLVLFLLLPIQALGGWLRPHLPGGNEVSTEDKSTARFVWEIAHRLSGYVLLFMAWYQIRSGLVRFTEIFPGTKDWTGLFWGVTICFLLLILVGFASQLFMDPQSKPKEEIASEKAEEEQPLKTERPDVWDDEVPPPEGGEEGSPEEKIPPSPEDADLESQLNGDDNRQTVGENAEKSEPVEDQENASDGEEQRTSLTRDGEPGTKEKELNDEDHPDDGGTGAGNGEDTNAVSDEAPDEMDNSGEPEGTDTKGKTEEMESSGESEHIDNVGDREKMDNKEVLDAASNRDDGETEEPDKKGENDEGPSMFRKVLRWADQRQASL